MKPFPFTQIYKWTETAIVFTLLRIDLKRPTRSFCLAISKMFEGKKAMQHFKIPRSRVDRVPFVLDFCSGKNVLHLGCTDAPFTEENIKEGIWLPDRLMETVKDCLVYIPCRFYQHPEQMITSWCQCRFCQRSSP